MLMRKLRKGQAELIGGLIVVSVLILIVLPLLISMMTTSTIVVTRIYSTRSQFEIDRWSEKLQLTNDSYGTYRLANVGPVTVEIVRVWYANGSLVELTPWKVVAVGSSLPITELGVNNPKDVDRIVTSRGRIFKMIELIPPPAPAAPTAPNLLEALAKNITLGYYLVSRYNGTYGVVANYSTDGTTWSKAYVAYRNGTRWLVFNESTCSWVERNLTIPLDQADLDNNNIVELVLLDSNYNVVFSGRSSTLTINITLYRCDRRGFISLTDETEILMVYFKFVARYANVDTDTDVTITLRRVEDGVVYRSTAVFSRAMIRGAAINITDIYQGYIIYPFKGFTGGYGVAGNYNLELLVDIDAEVANANITINTEYVAIVTYP